MCSGAVSDSGSTVQRPVILSCGWSCSPEYIWRCLEKFLVGCHNCAIGICWVEARDSAKLRTVHRTTHITKNPAQTINATVETPCDKHKQPQENK